MKAEKPYHPGLNRPFARPALWAAGAFWLVLLAMGCFALAQASLSGAPANPVYESLVQPPAGDPIRLPPPRFTDVQSAEQQRTELERAGGDRYRADALLRPNVLAPHVLRMERERVEEHGAMAQRVRVVFALRGNLETFTRESFLDSLLAGADDVDAAEPAAVAGTPADTPLGASRELTAEELQAAGVGTDQDDVAASQSVAQEHYRLVHGELFSRVRFSGVVRSFASRSDQSVLWAMRFDDRFAHLPGLRGTWQRLERDEAGELHVAQQGDFLGGGAYIKVTRWREDAEILLFEAELMLLEPLAWFGGSNLLGSKLPPAIQSQVREIRRAALRAAN